MDQKDKPTSAEASSFESPTSLDFRPEPDKPVRIGRKPAAIAWVLVVALLGLFAYGGWKRQERQVAALSDNGPKHIAPATSAGSQISHSVPVGNAPITKMSAAGVMQPDFGDGELQPDPSQQQLEGQNGRRPKERIATGQPPVPAVQGLPMNTEPSPEEKRVSAAYRQELEAIAAPTGIRQGFGAAASGDFGSTLQAGGTAPVQTGILPRTTGDSSGEPMVQATSARDNDYDQLNMQTRKESFLGDSRRSIREDNLRSVRTAPLSHYEIKAGWEIPAVLEQALNSDLPGEIKALVTANVYDTATGRYLLVPQGARLIGDYDSHVAYGQDGVQAVWHRVIYPDASSIDLSGMEGLDSQGNSGLRHTVDRHYKRLIGFTALSSLFTAGFGLSQNRSGSVLTYPSPTEVAGNAVGQEVSQTGAQITRRNLNVQPTIKVPAGYKFIVRVNRDIIFDTPYEPVIGDVPATGVLRKR